MFHFVFCGKFNSFGCIICEAASSLLRGKIDEECSCEEQMAAATSAMSNDSKRVSTTTSTRYIPCSESSYARLQKLGENFKPNRSHPKTTCIYSAPEGFSRNNQQQDPQKTIHAPPKSEHYRNYFTGTLRTRKLGS